MVLAHGHCELQRVLSVMADAPPEPLLFHCVAGKDRTGLIAALVLALADVTPAAIARDYAISEATCARATSSAMPKPSPPAFWRHCAVPRKARTTCCSSWRRPAGCAHTLRGSA